MRKRGSLDHLYGSARWHRIRKYQLMTNPMCGYCLVKGLAVPATICDHVEPHYGDINKFWGSPFQSLCKECHDAGKRFEEQRGYRPDIGLDGYPLDPKHPFYRNR
jgi:5-methylcytosine-specific restriction enzyme A